MNVSRRLAEALLRTYPAESARTVETLEPALQAEVLRGLDGREAAAVVTEMAPHVACTALASMSAAEVSSIVVAMPTSAAAALFRRMSPEVRAALLAEVPNDRSQRVTRLVEQSEDTAGAHADPDVVALPVAMTAQEARSTYSSAFLEATYEIPVVASDGRLVGVVPLGALSNAAGSARMDAIMVKGAPALVASRSITFALEAPAWEGRSSLPVVDAAGTLVGLLRHETLRLVARIDAKNRVPTVSTSQALGEVFGTAFGGMLEAVVSASAEDRKR